MSFPCRYEVGALLFCARMVSNSDTDIFHEEKDRPYETRLSERLLLRVIFPRLFGISLLDATGVPLEAWHIRAAVHASAEGRRSALRQTKSASKLPPRLKGFLPILSTITKKIRSCPVHHILMAVTSGQGQNDRSLKMHTEHALVLTLYDSNKCFLWFNILHRSSVLCTPV